MATEARADNYERLARSSMSDRWKESDFPDSGASGTFGDSVMPDVPDFAALEGLPPGTASVSSLEELRGLLVEVLDEKVSADTSCGHLHPADIFHSLVNGVDLESSAESVILPPILQDRCVAWLNAAVLLDERAVDVLGRFSGPEAQVENLIVSVEYPENEAPLLWVSAVLVIGSDTALTSVALVETAWDVQGDCLHPLEPEGAGGLLFVSDNAGLDPSVLQLFLPDRMGPPRSRLQAALETQYDELRSSLRDRALFWLARTTGEAPFLTD